MRVERVARARERLLELIEYGGRRGEEETGALCWSVGLSSCVGKWELRGC